MDISHILKRYADFTILSGAGLSMEPPTCRPGAPQLMRAILKEIAPRSGLLLSRLPDMEQDPRRVLRFETLLGILRDICDPDLTILDVLERGKGPNPNHRMCSDFLNLGWSHITCNFDTYIEEVRPTPSARRYDILVWESDYRKWQGGPALCKIHGSLRDGRGRRSLKSVRTTLDTVGKGVQGFSFEPARRRVLESLLSESPLLIVGYSGNDDFDVIPLLQNYRSDRDVIWVDYAPGPPRIVPWESSREIGLRIQSHLRAFRAQSRTSSRIVLIQGETYSLLASLAKRFSIPVPPQENEECPSDIQKEIRTWAETQQIDEATRTAIEAELLLAINERRLAKNRYTILMETARQSTEGRAREMYVRAHIRMGIDADNRGMYAVAKVSFREALGIARRNFPGLRAFAHHCLGNSAFDQGRYLEAVSRYSTALRMYKSESDAIGSIATIFQVGRLRHNQGYLREAGARFRHARDIVRRRGRIDLLAIASNLLGVLSWQEGRLDRSWRYFDDALALKRSYGADDRQEAATLYLRALLATDDEKRISRRGAFMDLERALQIYGASGDPLGVAVTLYARGRIHEASGEMGHANADYHMALHQATLLKALKGIAVSHQGIARTSARRREKVWHHASARTAFQRLRVAPGLTPKTPDSLERRLEVFV